MTALSALHQMTGEAMLAADSSRKMRLRSDDVVWRTDEDEIVVLELGTGTYLTLNGSGKLLWLRLADGCSASELSLLLQASFGIPEELASADASAFLQDLIERNLLVEEA